jgi:osmotically-inducible protein OsmY
MKEDQKIQKDVMEELTWIPYLDSSEIGVAVKNGVVTLSGTVDTFGKKAAAEEAAKSVAGVRAVAEDIVVKTDPLWKKTDGELAEAVLNALKWHATVPREGVQVIVENGWVTLTGKVDWEFQRNAAITAIQNLHGIQGIINKLMVKDSKIEKDVKQKISAAFHRNATIDSEKVHVEVDGNKVILSGTVGSWTERMQAERAAWNARGITAVENNIQVGYDGPVDNGLLNT